jgi:hypothetical protein
VTVQEAEAPETEQRPLAAVSAAALAWGGVSAIFILLRLGPIWQAPVAGPELLHLSGAWEAHLGHGDARFVPTLFQAVTAVLLGLSTSEIPARAVAFMATASIPLAVYFLRPQLGEAGALLALIFLALDGPAISLGVSASAMAFDLALVCWLFVALTRQALPIWAWALAGFLTATAGPLMLPLVGAAGGLALLSRRAPPRPAMVTAGCGAVAGVVLASFRFGLGWDSLRVPPLDLFAAGYDEPWSTASTGALFAIYSVPVVAAGFVATGWLGYGFWRVRAADRHTPLLLAWAALSLPWFLSSFTSHNPAALVALTTPLALALGPVAAGAIAAMFRADWRYARWLLPFAGLAALVALAIVVDWARVEQSGPSGERLLVASILLVSGAGVAAVLLQPGAAACLVAAAVVALGLPALASTMGVALSAGQEPIASPLSPAGARNLRDLAVQLRAEQGGPIVIHADLREAMTWPFRNSGLITLDSRPGPGAAILILPDGAQPPPGYVPLEGNWALSEEVLPPTASSLKYLHWRVDRNDLAIRPLKVAVYTGTTE